MGTLMNVSELIRKVKLVFWDFDGVIKESVDIKTGAYVSLFERYGPELADRVKLHHEANGGMSRFIKFPLYLEWAGETVTSNLVNKLCDEFSLLTFNGVINAPWVPGAEAYLRNNTYDQIFVLVSATPKEELIKILQELDLNKVFSAIYGAPTGKNEAIADILSSKKMLIEDSVMIGDAVADYEAAFANNVSFILRRHTSNINSFSRFIGYAVNNISEL